MYQASSHNGHHDIVELQISGIKELRSYRHQTCRVLTLWFRVRVHVTAADYFN